MKIQKGEAAQLHVFSSFAIGGAQVRFATLANRLGREFRYRIFAIDGCYGACELLSQDIDYQIVDLADQFVIAPRWIAASWPILITKEIRWGCASLAAITESP